MHAHIASFPSKVMYHSRLKSHDSVKTHLLRDLPTAHVDSEDDEKEVLGTPVVFYDTAGCEYFERVDGVGDEGSKCNENEASVVKMWVEQLVSCFQPYIRSQCVLIRTLVGICRCSHLPDRSDHAVCTTLPS